MSKTTKVIFLIMLGFIAKSTAQLGFSHEIGVIAGPLELRSDFGERQNFETNSSNMGFGIGVVHFLNFAYREDCNCRTRETFFKDHFKIRSELSWNRTQLNHFGRWVDVNKTSENAERLRTHQGESSNLNLGVQLEYYIFSIRDFEAFANRFDPYVSFGVQYTYSSPKVSTTYGDGNIFNPDNFFSEWAPGSIAQDNFSVMSIVTSVGVRYKLTALSDLMLDLRWQFFNSDWVDGLNHQLDSNKYNDRLVWLNFGYIFYIQ